MEPTPEFVGPLTPAQQAAQQRPVYIPKDLYRTPDYFEVGYGRPRHPGDFDDTFVPPEEYFATGTTPIDKKYRLAEGPLTDTQQQFMGRILRRKDFREPPEIIQFDPAALVNKSEFLEALGLGVSATGLIGEGKRPEFGDPTDIFRTTAEQQPQETQEGDK